MADVIKCLEPLFKTLTSMDDRACAAITTRKMTPEEIEKYGPPNKRNEHYIGNVVHMRRKGT